MKRKDGRWEGRATVRYDPTTGRAKRVSVYGRTRKEAAEKLAEVLRRLAAGTYIEPSRLTFGQWLDRWLEEYKKPKLRRTTWESYWYMAKGHLKPTLGHLRLQELRADHLQALCNEKLKSGVSVRTVHYMHQVARGALILCEVLP